MLNLTYEATNISNKTNIFLHDNWTDFINKIHDFRSSLVTGVQAFSNFDLK